MTDPGWWSSLLTKPWTGAQLAHLREEKGLALISKVDGGGDPYFPTSRNCVFVAAGSYVFNGDVNERVQMLEML